MSKIVQTYQNVTLNITDEGKVFAVFQDGTTASVGNMSSPELIVNEMSLQTIALIGTAGYMVRGLLDCIVASKQGRINAFGECVKTTLLP